MRAPRSVLLPAAWLLALASGLALTILLVLESRTRYQETAQLRELRARDSALVRQTVAERDSLARELAAATAAGDTARRAAARSDSLRRRLVLVARPPVTPPSDSHDTVRRGDGPGGPDTVAVDLRVLELVAAQDTTILAQRGQIARLESALAGALRSIDTADSLAAVRAERIRLLEQQVPPAWRRRAERVVIAAAAGYAGYRLGRALR